VLTDCGILFRAERSSAVVVEWEKYLDQVHRGLSGSEAQHSEHEKQPSSDDGREQQGPETAQTVREEEEHDLSKL
jgi:hypothetical protein